MKKVKKIIYQHICENKIIVLFTCLLFITAVITSLIPAKITQLIIDKGFIAEDYEKILLYSIILLVLYISKVVCDFLTNKFFINISTNLIKRLKDEIYKRILYLDMSFFNKKQVGYINSRINEVNTIDVLFSTTTLSLFSSFFQFIIAYLILLNINWKFVLVMSAPIPILMFISHKISGIVKKQIDDSLDNNALYSGKVTESISGIENVKAQALEEKEEEKISLYNTKMSNSNKKKSNTINNFSGGMSLISNILSVLIYIVGGWFFVKGELTLGAFLAASAYVSKLYSPIFTYSSTMILLQPAIVSLKRIGKLFFEELNTDDETETKSKLTEINKIDFKDVSFSYNSEKQLINNFNLTINKGDRIIIKGENGTGKSTLFRLLLKLYKVDKGVISINDVCIKNINKNDIVNKIIYVSQRIFLFNDTIINNILYGLDNYDKDKLDELLKILNIKKLIDRLNKESDGLIGDNGSNLSGGEIQKIALIRALIRNPEFLILDEAMTNLDIESRNYIRTYINNIKCTLIVVDHTHYLEEICNKEIYLGDKNVC